MAKTSRPRTRRPRPFALGDRSPILTARGIEEVEVRNAMEGAKLAKLNAIRDVFENAERCKKRARLNALRYVLHRMPYTSKDVERIGGVDPLIVGRASAIFEQAERRNGDRARPR